MTDDTELAGVNPCDLLDEEAARLDAYFQALDDAALAAASRCAGWTVRDVLAHLAGTEEYHHACLDGDLGPLFEKFVSRGATDVAGFNELAIRDRDATSAASLLDEWRVANAETRTRMRERLDGEMETSVGPYPVRWQAWHVASELATHADDAGVPVAAEEAVHRRAWRVRFSRFSVREMRPEVEFQVLDGATRVRIGDDEAVVPDHVLVEAVASRLPAGEELDPVVRGALSTMP